MMSELLDARIERFEKMELFGKTVLFTDLYVDPETVPSGLYLYSLRHGDDDSEPSTIEHRVFVNHFGDILTDMPFELSGTDFDPFIEIKEGDWSYLPDLMTVKEYLNRKKGPAK